MGFFILTDSAPRVPVLGYSELFDFRNSVHISQTKTGPPRSPGPISAHLRALDPTPPPRNRSLIENANMPSPATDPRMIRFLLMPLFLTPAPMLPAMLPGRTLPTAKNSGTISTMIRIRFTFGGTLNQTAPACQ